MKLSYRPYARYRLYNEGRGGRAKRTRLPSGIFRRASPCPNTGCWFWMGTVDHSNGYGLFGFRDGVERHVHRLAYQLTHGDIPEGMLVHHRCGQKLCINPDHLELTTNSEHTRLHGAMRRAARMRGIA